MLKLTLILPCFFALPLASMEQDDSWIDNFILGNQGLSAFFDDADGQSPEHGDTQRQILEDDSTPENNEWLNQTLGDSGNALIPEDSDYLEENEMTRPPVQVRGKMPIQPMGQRGRGVFPPMGQRGRGVFPPMGQRGRGVNQMQPMGQRGRGVYPMQPMGQRGRGGMHLQPVAQPGRGGMPRHPGQRGRGGMQGRGGAQGWDGREPKQPAPEWTQPETMQVASQMLVSESVNSLGSIDMPPQIPVVQKNHSIVQGQDEVVSRRIREEHEFATVATVFKKELELVRRAGNYRQEPWANEEWAKRLVKQISGLRIASIVENDITEVGKHYFPALTLYDSKVETIKFVASSMQASTYSDFLSMLRQNTKITTLEMKIGNLTDDDIFKLSLALRSGSVRHLMIDSLHVTTLGVLYLINSAKDLENLKTITINNLSGEQIPPAYIPVLAKEANLDGLTISYLPPPPPTVAKRKTR